MSEQKVANNPLGSYSVYVDRTSTGAEIQNVRLVPTITYIDVASGTVTYFGFAAPSTATSAAGWRILKQTVSGSITSILYAGGSLEYSFVWDNRASYSYS